jgi:hypothetical protein
MKAKFTLSSSAKKPGDFVILIKDKYLKHSYLYVDPNCEFWEKNSGFTCENIGVVLDVHLDENGTSRSKIMVNNGNMGWISSEYLEVVKNSTGG